MFISLTTFDFSLSLHYSPFISIKLLLNNLYYKKRYVNKCDFTLMSVDFSLRSLYMNRCVTSLSVCVIVVLTVVNMVISI